MYTMHNSGVYIKERGREENEAATKIHEAATKIHEAATKIQNAYRPGVYAPLLRMVYITDSLKQPETALTSLKQAVAKEPETG